MYRGFLMNKNKYRRFLAITLLFCMPLTACNFDLPKNNSSSGNSSSSQTSSSSSSEEGKHSHSSQEEPKQEVTKEQYMAAANQALVNNPGYRTADISIELLSDGQSYDRDYRYTKEASATEWSVYSDVAQEDYVVYYTASSMLRTNAYNVINYAEEQANAKYYFDNNGFRFLARGELNYDGVNIEYEIDGTFDLYGYLTKGIQIRRDNGVVSYSVNLEVTYSTDGGGQIDPPAGEEEVTYAEFMEAANAAMKRECNYLTAIADIESQENEDHSESYHIIFSKDAPEDDWEYADGDNDSFAVMMASSYVKMRLTSNLSPDGFQDPHYYVNDNGFRFTGRWVGESGSEIFDMVWDRYGYVTRVTDTSGDDPDRIFVFSATYSNNPYKKPGEDDPVPNMSDSEWNAFVKETQNYVSSYRSAILLCFYDERAADHGTQNSFEFVYSNATGRRSDWVQYSSTASQQMENLFAGLIYSSPSNFANSDHASYHSVYVYDEDDNTYSAYATYGNNQLQAKFDEHGFILYAEITESDSSTTLHYGGTVNYSTESLEPGGGEEDFPEGNMTASEWGEYCEYVSYYLGTVYTSAETEGHLYNEKVKLNATASFVYDDGWKTTDYEGDKTVLSYISSSLLLSPLNFIIPDPDSFEGNVAYFIEEDNEYRCIYENDGVYEDRLFDQYGYPISATIKTDSYTVEISFTYSSGGQEEDDYDTAVRALEEGDMYVMGGDPTIGWDFINPSKELFMKASSINDVSKFSTDLADTLQAKKDKITHLYTKTVTIGTDEAGWTNPLVINGYKYTVDGALTIKACSGIYDEGEEQYTNTTWYPDVNGQKIENLSPNTLYMPEWGTDTDAYGIDGNGNPVAYEPGEYVLVMVGYNTAASLTTCSGGMALIRVGDIESPLEKPVLTMGYNVMVNGNPYQLVINPGNRQEFVSQHIYVEEDEVIEIKDIVDQSIVHVELDSYSSGFDLSEGQIICTESGYYDFYVTINYETQKVYIGYSSIKD